MEITFITGKLNSKKYIKMIDDQINTYTAQIVENNSISQNDNAAVDITKAVKHTNKKNRIFEAKSSNLNTVENYWGNLSSIIYWNGRRKY